MKMAAAVATGVFVVLIAASSASAEVQLAIRDGRVTLVATNATVRQILTEWARVGQTKIVNVERIPGGPQTLQLTNMPEQEALDLLLRSVTGFVAAERPVAAANLSRYDRILVLPTTAVARVAVPAAQTPVFQQPSVIQRLPPDPNDDEPGVVQEPRGPLFPTFQAVPPGTAPRVVVEQRQPGTQQPQTGTPAPAEPVVSPFPGASAVGTPRPGMVVQPPQPVPGVIVFPGQQTAPTPEN